MVRRLMAWLVLAGLGVSTVCPNGVHADERKATADHGPVTLAAFDLKDSAGTAWQLDSFKDQSVLVVAFVGTECPLAKLYALRLQSIAKEFDGRSVAFLGVDSNPQDSLAEISGYVRDHHLTFPVVKDARQTLLRDLRAERTPEVVVLNQARQVVYRGRIDDQHTVGRSRPEPTRHDLKLAIEETLAGKPVSVAETPVVGCLVSRLPAATNDAAAVTYHRDIVPLLHKHCVECHRPGEIGPFSLTSYEEAAGWSEMMLEVTQEKRMPPWHANDAHGEFANARRLTAEELKVFKDWVAAGLPKGNPADEPAFPQFADGWQLLRTPDLILPMTDKPVPVKAEGEVRYQYFSIDPKFTEDKWVSGVEIRPGNRAVVHHIIAFASAGGQRFNGERQFLTAYVPGLRVRDYADGMAKKIPAGSKLVFQVHYTPNGTATEDHSHIGLIFTDAKKVKYEIRTESVGQQRLEIKPQLANQQFKSNSLTSPADVTLLSMSPHMHLRGQSFRYELTWPDGRQEVLLDVPHYDFNWQTAYLLKEPIVIPQGAKLQAFAQFDNSPDNLANPNPNETVRWGDQSWEEMMLGYFDIAVPHQQAGSAAQTWGLALAALKSDKDLAAQIMKSVDKNGDGFMDATELSAKYRPLMKEGDTDGDGKISMAELIEVTPRIRAAMTNR